MKQGIRVIDSELHLMEPFDLWERGLQEPYRAFTHITPPPDGHLVPSGTRIQLAELPAAGGAPLIQRQAARRFPTAPHLVEASNHCSSEVFLAGMEIEGIDVAILAPTLGVALLNHDGLDPQYALALCRVYNDYAYQFTRANPERFKFWAWVPRQAPELAAAEARRCVEQLGAVGAAMTIQAVDGHLLGDDIFTPLWEELNRLHTPAGFHVRTGGVVGDNFGSRYAGHRRTEITANVFLGAPFAQSAVAEMILGGVLEAYPAMKLVIMESNASWLPWLLWRMDEKWELYEPDVDYRLSMKPSEYFRRSGYAVVDAGEATVKHVIDAIGDDNLLFSTDYPHHDTPFPNAVDTFLALEGITNESKHKMLWANGARLYELPTPALGAPAGGGDSLGSGAAAR